MCINEFNRQCPAKVARYAQTADSLDYQVSRSCEATGAFGEHKICINICSQDKYTIFFTDQITYCRTAEQYKHF